MGKRYLCLCIDDMGRENSFIKYKKICESRGKYQISSRYRIYTGLTFALSTKLSASFYILLNLAQVLNYGGKFIR